MSNLWFNIRFGTRHLQIGRSGISLKVNPYQVDWKNKNPETWKWFTIYIWFGRHI